MKQTCVHCDRQATARGLCLMHYKRAKNAGELERYSKQESRNAYKRLDLSGQRFGKLLVLECSGTKTFACGDAKTVFKCLCDCGNTSYVLGSSLTRPKGTKSCGCDVRSAIAERSTTHGMTGTRVYRIWQAMLNRCRNANVKIYSKYGGRGISVCDRWSDFENFFADMGDPPDGYSIDRINNDGDYTPENCRWASGTDQARNKSTNRRITLNGETRLLVEWSETLGIDQASLRERLEKWPLEAALTTPRKG